jgi:hypothetical protein
VAGPLVVHGAGSEAAVARSQSFAAQAVERIEVRSGSLTTEVPAGMIEVAVALRSE